MEVEDDQYETVDYGVDANARLPPPLKSAGMQAAPGDGWAWFTRAEIAEIEGGGCEGRERGRV